MKKYIWICAAILTLILIFVLWHRPQSTGFNVTIDKGLQPTGLAATNTTSSIQSNATPISKNVQPTNPAPSDAHNLSVREAIQRDIDARNVPVEFYGQFIDQDSNAIPGVDIKIALIHLTMPDSAMTELVGSKTIHLEQNSDANGRFTFTGETGTGFDLVSVEKAGYELSSKIHHSFGAVGGSYENPIVFKMWKTGDKEQLISGRHVFGIDSGKIYTLNLVTGKKVEGVAEGDLLVSITRPPDAKPRVNFPWSFSIEAIQGGFAEPDPDDEFMNIAPQSGYQPKIEMQFDPNNSAWVGIINKQFFIRSRDGQIYGRVQAEIDSIYNVHSAIQIDYTINPNGSRNLQP